MRGRWWILMAGAVLAGCVAGGARAPETNPITGAAIATTSLDAPAQAQATAPVAPGPASPAAGVPPRPVADAPAPAPQVAGSLEVKTPPPAPLSPEAVACEKRGGTWARAGKGGGMTCIQPTRDAGKACRRQSDCEGLCLARSRSCAPIRPMFGCNDILQDDGREVTLCID